MMDRFRVCSPLVALALASVCALSACDQGKPQEPTQVTTSAVVGSLQPGDVALTCINSATDEVQFVSLVALAAGTDLKYTDNEWSGTDWRDFGETTDYPIPLPGAGMTPGEQLLFVPRAGLPNPGGVSNGPEQFFFYQGGIQPDGGGYNLVWGTQISNPVGWATPPVDGGTLGNNLSVLPSTLSGANLALGIANPDTFWAYTGPTRGTKAQLLADLQNASNWSGPGPVDGGAQPCPGAFTVDPDVVDSGAGSDGSTSGDTGMGAGGAGGSDAGAGGMVGTTDSGAGGTTDAGANPDVPADSGAGGVAGADGGAADTGTGGKDGGGATDSGAGGATGAGGMTGGTGGSPDGGSDAKVDTGTTTDAKADTGSTGGTDAKVDTGSTGGTDAKTTADAGKDSGTTTKSSNSGCSCSTAPNGQNLSASVSLLTLAGIVMTARRRRRR